MAEMMDELSQYQSLEARLSCFQLDSMIWLADSLHQKASDHQLNPLMMTEELDHLTTLELEYLKWVPPVKAANSALV